MNMSFIKIEPIRRHVAIFLLGGASVSLLRLLLYLRPGPFATPYVLDISRELPLALLFGWYGIALISLPFFLVAWVSKSPSRGRLDTKCFLHIFLVFASLLIGHADNEIHRFMGIPISLNYLATYGNLGRTPAAISHAIADDPGGAYSAYMLLILPAVFVLVSLFLCNRQLFWRAPSASQLKIPLAAGIGLFYLLPPVLLHTLDLSPGAIERTRPPLLAVFHEIQNTIRTEQNKPVPESLVEAYRKWWLEGDPRQQWEFYDAAFPLRKRFTESDTTPKTPAPNFIILQLETFRAKNMRLFSRASPGAATPFLDRLGQAENSAYWPRFYCNGLPTVYAFMAMHTGILPHSDKRVATAFTHIALEGFPDILRKHGYHTSFFSGPDPDWDNERYWLNKWYDHVVFEQTFEEKDRALFHEAATYLKERGSRNQPFLAVIVSITNHVPFRSPEPEFNPPKGADITERLQNTMRYTDDVVREFYTSIETSPWFANTVVIITGDHGYDLGDRGWFIGHSNLRHECTWVPLIMHGKNPLVPCGKQLKVGSHIDLAPTILELAGIHADNSFMGHSLLETTAQHSTAITIRTGNYAVETPSLSVYLPAGEKPMAFSSDDPLQLIDIARTHGNQVENARQASHLVSEIADACYQNDAIAPDR